MKKIIVGLLASILLFGCGDKNDQQDHKNKVESETNNVAVVANTEVSDSITNTEVVNNVYTAITEKNHPDFYKKWEKEWITQINLFGPLAAEFVADQKVCKKITQSALNNKLSVPQEKVVYQVSCANGSQHEVTMDALQPQERKWYFQSKVRHIDQPKYIARCVEAVKNNVVNGSSIDFTKAKKEMVLTTANSLGVLIYFTDKNASGESKDMKVLCDFADGLENFNPKTQFFVRKDFE